MIIIIVIRLLTCMHQLTPQDLFETKAKSGHTENRKEKSNGVTGECRRSGKAIYTKDYNAEKNELMGRTSHKVGVTSEDDPWRCCGKKNARDRPKLEYINQIPVALA